MNNKKIIFIIAIVLLIIAIIVISIILLNSKKEEGTIYIKNDGTAETVPEPEMDIKYQQKLLREPTEFFSIEEYIQSNIDNNFVAIRMNYLQGKNIMTYSVYGTTYLQESNQKEEKYFLVRIDMKNMTCEVKEIEDKNYKNVDEIVLIDDETQIENTGNNIFEYTPISDEEMCRKYYNDFKQKELNNPEEAYLMLDEEYREKRFPNYDEFIQYIDEKRTLLENAVLSKYAYEYGETYTECTLIDTQGNTYIIKAESVMEYTIKLDSYTIKIDTYEEKYSDLSDNEKVKSNVYLFLQMINAKDYRQAYDLLDETFKNNNFNTLESFRSYIENNFFDYNLDVSTGANVEKKGSLYVYTSTLKNGPSSAAESKNLNVIMQLKEGTDFVMSFSIE